MRCKDSIAGFGVVVVEVEWSIMPRSRPTKASPNEHMSTTNTRGANSRHEYSSRETDNGLLNKPRRPMDSNCLAASTPGPSSWEAICHNHKDPRPDVS
mmetsp:Transcript_22118/g.48347  ORF Transcript_22118/g.48347 Transcript_22118/m.48347 type:complete len:98 (-) Transcript_22118:35-328(-)